MIDQIVKRDTTLFCHMLFGMLFHHVDAYLLCTMAVLGLVCVHGHLFPSYVSGGCILVFSTFTALAA